MATKKQFGSFQSLVSDSEIPLLVDFYAPWCGPCQLMAKILAQVSVELKDKMQVVKINTDNYPELASQHQIQALPTLVVFNRGQIIDRIEGVLPADQLLQRLQKLKL
jgi:thioredoxin